MSSSWEMVSSQASASGGVALGTPISGSSSSGHEDSNALAPPQRPEESQLLKATRKKLKGMLKAKDAATTAARTAAENHMSVIISYCSMLSCPACARDLKDTSDKIVRHLNADSFPCMHEWLLAIADSADADNNTFQIEVKSKLESGDVHVEERFKFTGCTELPKAAALYAEVVAQARRTEAEKAARAAQIRGAKSKQHKRAKHTQQADQHESAAQHEQAANDLQTEEATHEQHVDQDGQVAPTETAAVHRQADLAGYQTQAADGEQVAQAAQMEPAAIPQQDAQARQAADEHQPAPAQQEPGEVPVFADSELNPVPIAASKTGLPAAPHKQQHIPGQNCEITVKDQNGKTAEVEVFCTPDGKVYLNLLYGLNNNHAVYGPGQNTQGTPTTYYTKVRFDPVKLVIIIDDDTFAITNGHTWDNGKETHSVCNFGTASDCAALKSVGGRANINLTKTKLAVKPGQFKLDGWEANGNTQFSNQCQVVDLVGGGFCGSNQPETNEIQLEVVGSEWQPFGISNEE